MTIENDLLLIEQNDNYSSVTGFVYRVGVTTDRDTIIADGVDIVTITVHGTRYNGPLDRLFTIPIKINNILYTINISEYNPKAIIQFKTGVAGPYIISVDDIPLEVNINNNVITATGTNIEPQTYEAMQKQIDSLNIALANIMGV